MKNRSPVRIASRVITRFTLPGLLRKPGYWLP